MAGKQWLVLSLSSFKFTELLENLRTEACNYFYSLEICFHNNS